MSPIRMEKIETAVRVVLQFSEAFNRHDVPAMLQCLGDDPVLEPSTPAPGGESIQGKEALAHYWQEIFAQSPQLHLEVEEVFGYGFRCVLLWKITGSIRAGVPDPIRGVTLFKLSNGLISGLLSYRK